MLDDLTFIAGLRKLEELHKGYLIDVRMKRYYEAVKHLNEGQYDRLVNHFLDTAKSGPFNAPTPDDFRMAAVNIRNGDESKMSFKDVNESDPRNPERLKQMLEKYGVRSLLEAVELEAQKRRQKG